VPYQTPGDDIVAIIDAPPTPAALLAPGGNFVALVHYEAHPPVSQLARPYLALAGVRVDPAIAGRQRTRRLTAISVLSLPGGGQQQIGLPAGAAVSVPVWAPDGRHFAFTLDASDGISVWAADAATATAALVPGLRVRDILGGDPMSGGGTLRWSRDSRSLLALAAPPRPAPLPAPVIEPQIEESAGKHSQMPTFQDLLRSPADEDIFQALATTVPLRVDPVTGAAAELGPAGLYQLIHESPDGEHLLVRRLQRPFSYRVPYPYFARRTEVWGAAGGLQRVIADLPVSDEVPRHGVPTGPRGVTWAERQPASLLWTEALDGGDPLAAAEHRDAVMRLDLAAPTSRGVAQCFLVGQRCLGWLDTAEPDQLLLVEHDRDRRWLTTWLADLRAPERNRIIFDRAADDAYGDPGSPLMARHPDGTRTTLQDGTAIYLRGDGASASGDRPFLDRLDLTDAASVRLFESPPDAFEQVIGFAGPGRAEVLLWHESRAEPPNLVIAALAGPARRQLTSWPDPHPQLTAMSKRLVTHDRGDGVQLSGMLHLPPGYDPARSGRLPLVIWAYPLDYGNAATAGQVRGSSATFTWLTAAEPV